MKGKITTCLIIGGVVTFSFFVLAVSLRSGSEKYTFETEFYINNTEFSAAADRHISATDASYPETDSTEAATQELTDFLWIDINRADSEELSRLSGIGSVTADKIIAYRTGAGGFSDITEIINVDGVGEKTFAAIKDHIYVTQEYTVPYEPSAENEESYVSEETFAEETVFVPETTDVQESVPEPEIIPIDINAASAEDFDRLPGISAELAENIIALRTSIQYFQHIDELFYAEGMTVEIFSGIKGYVYVAN